MILEEETYKKFGYYTKELSQHANKHILVRCDCCGETRQISKHGYRSLCRSCAQKGKHPKLGGVKGSKSPSWKGGKVKIKCEFCGKTFVEYLSNRKKGHVFCSVVCARKAKKMPTHHTKPERIFEDICKKNNLPFKYTGDGDFWIQKINPDFVECNGKKIAVEVFGDYWHSPLLNYRLREDRTLYYRKKILNKYGWKLIVFWETDLLRKDAEAFVLNTLKSIISHIPVTKGYRTHDKI